MSSDVSTPESSSSESSPEAPANEQVKQVAIALAKGLGPWLLIVLAALYSQLSFCRAGHMSATPGHWQAAAEYLRQERALAPGSLIVFAPGWIAPLGRQYLGDQMDIDMVARMDAARYASIWEVSMGGERASETHGLKADQHKRFGPLYLRHYSQAAAELLFDFTAQWRSAKTSGAMQGRPNLSLEEVGFEPHRCIKVVPTPGQSATMQFDAANLGSSIVGYVGLADVFTRRDVRDPGQLELLIDGKIVASLRVGVDEGWKRFSVNTSPGTAKVEFRLTAVGPKARDRRICFAAEARR